MARDGPLLPDRLSPLRPVAGVDSKEADVEKWGAKEVNDAMMNASLVEVLTLPEHSLPVSNAGTCSSTHLTDQSGCEGHQAVCVGGGTGAGHTGNGNRKGRRQQRVCDGVSYEGGHGARDSPGLWRHSSVRGAAMALQLQDPIQKNQGGIVWPFIILC